MQRKSRRLPIHEGNVERVGIIQGLLHAIADAVVIILGFNEGEGDIRLVIEDIVGALGLAASDQLAADDDASLGEADFLANLQHFIPAGLLDCRGDELGANSAFAEGLLVHAQTSFNWELSPDWPQDLHSPTAETTDAHAGARPLLQVA